MVLRRLLSVLLVLVGVALLPAALVSAWADRTVTDTDGYVEAVAPLAEEEVVREAVSRRVAQAVVAVVDPTGRAGELEQLLPRADLRPFLEEAQGEVGAAVDAYAERLVARAVADVLDTQLWPELWATANRSAHRALMDALAQERGGATQVRIDLTEVVDVVLRQLGPGLVAAGVDAPTTSFTVADGAELDRARAAYQRVDGAGLWVPLACAASLLLALAVSPRRRRTLVVAAALALPVLGLLALAVLASRGVVESFVAAGEERVLVTEVWDALLADLWTYTGVAAGGALVVLLVALVSGRSSSRNP